jgi:hypothetical protein
VESRKRIVIARVARMLVRVGVVVIDVSEHRLPAAPLFESIGVPSLRRRELGLSSPLRVLIRNARPEVTCLPRTKGQVGGHDRATVWFTLEG